MQLPELIIFDMDGLIFDSERLFMEQKTLVMKEYGYVHRQEDYIQTLGTSGDELNSILLRLYGPDYPADEISARTRQAVTDYVRNFGITVKPGIRELLEELSYLQIPCCVASSSPKAHVRNYLLISGLEPFFSVIIGGDEVRHSKPAPDIFLKACEAYHVSPSKALVLEDSANGILAASNAQIPVICIPDLALPPAEILEKTAAVFSTAAGVLKLLS